MEAAIVSAAVSGTLKIVGNKLAPLLIKEYSSIVGVEKDLQELQGQVVEVNSWLETAGNIAMRDDPSFNWLKQLKDVTCAVDDVVDEFQLKAEKHDASSDGGIVSKYMCTKPKSFIFQCKAASKIKEIMKRFAAIVKQRTDFSTIANCLPVSIIGLGGQAGSSSSSSNAGLHGVSVSACLRLSYFHLPSHLKQCFTICSLFPKGHKINKEQLIDQWIVNDMITLEDGVDYLDYIGNKRFNSLMQMSFLQDVEEEEGRVICRMHDLVHDLARSILSDVLSGPHFQGTIVYLVSDP